MACTHTELRTAEPQETTRGRTSCYPRLFLSAAPKGELRRKETLASQLYPLSYTLPPTKTSTVARSNGFHVASPIHAFVSPR